jgi:hypothetical protein
VYFHIFVSRTAHATLFDSLKVDETFLVLNPIIDPNNNMRPLPIDNTTKMMTPSPFVEHIKYSLTRPFSILESNIGLSGDNPCQIASKN